jgi:hypothetical protein
MKEIDHLEDLVVDGRIMLKLILNKMGWYILKSGSRFKPGLGRFHKML